MRWRKPMAGRACSGNFLPTTSYNSFHFGEVIDVIYQLHTEDIALTQQSSAANEKVIVVIQAGSAVTVADWESDIEAVLMA